MKKLIIFLFTLIFWVPALGDIIPDNSHLIDKCVKVTNANDFKDYYILLCIKSPSGDGSSVSLINTTQCIEKGYKFNRMYIIALKKADVKINEIDSVDWLKDKRTLKANIYVDCWEGYTENSNPVSAIEEDYKIAGFRDSILILFKSRELIRFIDGKPALARTFTYKNGVIYEESGLTNQTMEEPGILTRMSVLLSKNELTEFLIALLQTILTETFLLFILCKTWLKKNAFNTKQILLPGFLSSFATLPYVWFILPVLIRPTLTYMVISELSVVAIESVIIFKLLNITYQRAFIVSFLCNFFSFSIGILVAILR